MKANYLVPTQMLRPLLMSCDWPQGSEGMQYANKNNFMINKSFSVVIVVRRNLESSELPSSPTTRLGDEDLEKLGYAMLVIQEAGDDQKASTSAMGIDQLSNIGKAKGYNLSSGELR